MPDDIVIVAKRWSVTLPASVYAALLARLRATQRPHGDDMSMVRSWLGGQHPAESSHAALLGAIDSFLASPLPVALPSPPAKVRSRGVLTDFRVCLPGETKRIVTFRGVAASELQRLDETMRMNTAARLRELYPDGVIAGDEWRLWLWSRTETARLPWVADWQGRAIAYRTTVPVGSGDVVIDVVGKPTGSPAEVELLALQIAGMANPCLPKEVSLPSRPIRVPAHKEEPLRAFHEAIDRLHLGDSDGKGLYLGATRIKERGWTDAMIERFLGVCDDTCDNPHYKSADPMRLWRLARVLWAERTDDVKTAIARAKARREKRRGGD